MSPAEKKRTAAKESIRQSRRKVPSAPAGQPVIIKTTISIATGMRLFETSRYALGYVLAGTKRLYNGDSFEAVEAGNIYFVTTGTHYVEEVPPAEGNFEEITFFYTASQIGSIIAALSIEHNADTSARHRCEECHTQSYVIERGWPTLRYFFATVGEYISDGFYANHTAGEMLDLGSLIYQIITRPEGCLRSRVLDSTDPEKELMERQIREYIFTDLTLEEFAGRNNRSLTSFKKKFKSYFTEPPHRWVVRQRLMYARLGLVSTTKPIAQIGRECCFPNPSHFIRLFRREFGLTPAQYRRRYSEGGE